MKWLERPEFRWMVLTTLALAWIIRILLSQHIAVDLAVSATGLVLLGIIVWLLVTSDSPPVVLWENDTGTLALIRRWSVEVSSARLMGSVPIGIDLSHSAKKVLQSVYTRYSSGPAVEVIFIVARPLGDGMTKVGILVKRRGLRLWNVTNKVDSLKKQVVMDVSLLESAMRAAYPHLPVTGAGLNEVMIAVTGGIEHNAGIE